MLSNGLDEKSECPSEGTQAREQAESEGWTPGLEHAGQVLDHQTTFPTRLLLFFSFVCLFLRESLIV